MAFSQQDDVPSAVEAGSPKEIIKSDVSSPVVEASMQQDSKQVSPPSESQQQQVQAQTEAPAPAPAQVQGQAQAQAQTQLHQETQQQQQPQASDGVLDIKPSVLDTTPGPATTVTPLHGPLKNSDSPKPREALNREMYRIPSYAGWFSWSKIHTIERRALAEFFDGRSMSKTPKIYKEYRDFIINKYRENPRRVLTYTEVRKMLVGDVNLLRKVFDFLEYWGLINHHAGPESKQYQTITPAVHSTAAQGSETVPPGVRIVYPGSSVSAARLNMPADLREKSLPVFQPGNLVSHKDVFAKTPTSAEARTEAVGETMGKLTCSKCGADCTTKAFESTKKEGFLLCQNCFSTPDDGFAKDDFRVKEKSLTTQTSQEDWTRQEVLLLLEAVSKYGEDWNRVANHVGTKSKAECIMHFIKLPFGDQFLSNLGASAPDLGVSTQLDTSDKGAKMEQESDATDDPVDSKSKPVMHGSTENLETVDDTTTPPVKRRRLTPFADASNPILAQVAFLAAMVGPRVAAAAAQAAIAALAEEDPVASQILSSNNYNTQAGSQKDVLLPTGLQATSKELVKSEGLAEKDELPQGKAVSEQMQTLKDMETEVTASKDTLPSVTQVRAAVATAISAVAANAKLLADQEEREIEHLMSSIIENQLRKLQSKVEHFEELEFLLEREHLQVERARAQVLAEWLRYSQYHYNTGPG